MSEASIGGIVETTRPIRLVRRRSPSRNAVPHFRGTDLRLPPHPGAPDPSDLQGVRRWVAAAKRPTAVDLFSGAGGLSLGLADAGFTVLLGADSDKAAVETHHHNVGGLAYEGDLTDPTEFLQRLDAWGIEHVDLVAGGVPCQPFSQAGRSMIRHLVERGVRSQLDARAELWTSFIAVIEHLRPRAILLENVPDLAAWDDGAVIIALCESLRELGYRVDARILDAWEHGVPQHRRRLFLVGLVEDVVFDWPTPVSPASTLRDAIGDLPIVHGGQRDEELPYAATPASNLQKWLRRRMTGSRRKVVFDHITRAVRPDDAEAFALLAEGDTYDDLPDRLQRYRSDIFTDKYKRLAWNELSRTITAHIAKDGYWYIHPAQQRTLSVREAARVQTFPDDFRFAGHPSLRFRQIGNAVPPLLARALGVKIAEALRSDPRNFAGQQASDSAREELLAWHRDLRGECTWRAGGDHAWTVLVAELCLRRATSRRMDPALLALRSGRLTPAILAADTTAGGAALADAGLASRAGDILELARAIVERHDGEVPSTELELRALPLVGDYLVQAVRTFAFDEPAVLLDRPTARVMARLYGHDDGRRWQIRLDLFRLAGPLGPDRPFNHAMLALANAVCTSEKPKCGACPLRRHCLTAPATVHNAHAL